MGKSNVNPFVTELRPTDKLDVPNLYRSLKLDTRIVSTEIGKHFAELKVVGGAY